MSRSPSPRNRRGPGNDSHLSSPYRLQSETVRRTWWSRFGAPAVEALLALSRWVVRRLSVAGGCCEQALTAVRRGWGWTLEHGGDAARLLQARLQRRAQERAARPLALRDLLGRGGWALLAVFAARVVTSLLPLQVYAPEWYVRLGGELVNTSPVLLTGFVLLLSAGVINQNLQDSNRLPRLNLVLWFVQLALWVYLLVIPVQVWASVFVVQRAEARLAIQWSWVQRELASARQRQATPEEFKQLGEIEDKLKQQRTAGQRQIRFNLVREAIRVCLSAAVLVWALRWPLGALERGEAIL